ncbi:unnamed protein product [Peniophora sp. CBMAI 1063]|nr:unnamed protein product [Peniophora sp. CBMAI 1063]
MKLSHRGLNAWISSDNEEQDIYVWSPHGENVNKARWEEKLKADLVAGHIAVEGGQRLRVNVESDGSLGAIAIFLSVDGVPLHGPFLKGKGTAWMDGVSCAPKSGKMSGRFCFEYTSYEARHIEKNRKYHGAIGVLVRFLGSYEGPPGDEDDDDIEVLDNIDLPDTWRGSFRQDPESSLRVGFVTSIQIHHGICC